jgi:hypothetical protein
MIPVRWREAGKWRRGHVREVGPVKGPVLVYDSRNGGARSIQAYRLQIQTTGPRGGKRWEWLT